MGLRQEIDCLSCIHKDVYKDFNSIKDKLMSGENPDIDYIGNIGKKINCTDYRYINYEYYTKNDFRQMLIDKINNSGISTASLLIVNSIMDLLNKIESGE